MHRTKSQKHNERRKARKSRKQLKMFILTQIFIYLRVVIDYLIDFIFSLIYRNKKITIPPISKPFLCESASSIAKKIRNGTLKSEDVVQAFIDRINEVNPIINSVTDTRFEEAIQEAKKIDQDLADDKYSDKDFLKKPFLGVPFTTKESTACAGLFHSFGLTCRKDIKAKEDADMVAAMKAAGGILIANTNIPEINLWQETRNCLYGQTLNPYDTTRTTGGSSGGEASLLAACGTPMGLGTDIGGSIRMPAYFCGVFGHKTTCNIISTKGLTRRTGQELNTMCVAGPMSRYAEDIIPMLKVMAGSNVEKLKLDDSVEIMKLKYCYIEENNDIRCSKINNEVRTVMQKVITHFSNELPQEQSPMKLQIEQLKYSHKLWRYWMTQEGMDFAHELTNRVGRVGAFMELGKKLIGMSDYSMAAIFKLLDDKLPKENENWARETTKLLKENLLNELSTNGVLLYPSYTTPANYHYTALLRPFNFAYWSIFNVLKFPVTQVPLGLSADGLPVGIQVVAAPHNDHLCIAVAKHLEQVFGGYVPPFQV